MGPIDVGSDFGLGILTGLSLSLFILLLVSLTMILKNDVYGLSHWKLNVKLPLRTMWMNLGYWKHQNGDLISEFDDACAALLNEVLISSGILSRQNDSKGRGASNKTVSILDLGFGCGDQTSQFARFVQHGRIKNMVYVGLTLNKLQAQTASAKINREITNGESSSVKVRSESFKLFCGDAANPHSWDPLIKSAVKEFGTSEHDVRWLLALDCLYHFSPSRTLVFEYAATNIKAHIMAFDLILNESAGWRDRLAVTLIGLLLGCPMNAFLTESQYRNQLIQSGYSQQSIELRDISKDVFPGLVVFLTQQRAQLKSHGIPCKELTVMRAIFNWFYVSGALKATIVIAQNKTEPS